MHFPFYKEVEVYQLLDLYTVEIESTSHCIVLILFTPQLSDVFDLHPLLKISCLNVYKRKAGSWEKILFCFYF